MIDLALLRVIKYKEQFDKVYRYIPVSGIDKKTKAVANDIRKYFEANPDDEVIDFTVFRSMFFTVFHKTLSKADCDYYNKLITRMEQDVSETQQKNMINSLLELEFATRAANLIETYDQGEEINIVDEIDELLTSVKERQLRTTAFEYATFEDNTVGADEESGYEWPIPIMNEHYRNILAGDQYIIAARPGQGKTTFLTHLNTALAQQMPENKCIVWFNNESMRQRIMARQIQSAVYKTDSELKELKAQNKLTQAYIDVMGNTERVRVYDVHRKSHHHLEDILETIGRDNVGAIIFDMLDNVNYKVHGDMREDQRLEKLYQWARELGVMYNCPTFPTSQVSNEGAGLMFPTENMLKDSKTGKQGACDGIVMIGSSDDPLLQNKRGISMPKTKSKKEGMPDLREEVLFDGDKGRFV